jgi:hypothetical protein
MSDACLNHIFMIGARIKIGFEGSRIQGFKGKDWIPAGVYPE